MMMLRDSRLVKLEDNWSRIDGFRQSPYDMMGQDRSLVFSDDYRIKMCHVWQEHPVVSKSHEGILFCAVLPD
jgi:hypothetical protein